MPVHTPSTDSKEGDRLLYHHPAAGIKNFKREGL